MKDSVHDIADYFARRATRYRLSQETCPLARTLDLLPYAYALQQYIEKRANRRDTLSVLDAFGGSGFLSNGFSHAPIRFTVADCTAAYSLESDDRREIIVTDDYFKHMAFERPNAYDLIFAHGGLHHVYVKEETVECESSLGLQCYCVKNLAAMLRPGGLLVLGDVPKHTPSAAYSGNELTVTCPASELEQWIGGERMEFLRTSAGREVRLPDSARKCCSMVETEFRNRFHPTSLPAFFDDFVAAKTVHGHEACFVDFQRLAGMLESHSLASICRFAYPGAWLFADEVEAVWFFREMFGFGKSRAKATGIDTDETAVQDVIREVLGTRTLNGAFSVNWGVTYSIYMKH